MVGDDSEVDWNEVAKFLPTSKTDKKQIAARQKLWHDFDTSGSGCISLGEAVAALESIVKSDAMEKARPAVTRAFDFAKDFVKGSHKKGKRSAKDQLIEKSEFRIFLVALRQRLEYLQAFAQIDVGGDGHIEL